jgi:hypothetical protein
MESNMKEPEYMSWEELKAEYMALDMELFVATMERYNEDPLKERRLNFIRAEMDLREFHF